MTGPSSVSRCTSGASGTPASSQCSNCPSAVEANEMRPVTCGSDVPFTSPVSASVAAGDLRRRLNFDALPACSFAGDRPSMRASTVWPRQTKVPTRLASLAGAGQSTTRLTSSAIGLSPGCAARRSMRPSTTMRRPIAGAAPASSFRCRRTASRRVPPWSPGARMKVGCSKVAPASTTPPVIRGRSFSSPRNCAARATSAPSDPFRATVSSLIRGTGNRAIVARPSISRSSPVAAFTCRAIWLVAKVVVTVHGTTAAARAARQTIAIRSRLRRLIAPFDPLEPRPVRPDKASIPCKSISCTSPMVRRRAAINDI